MLLNVLICWLLVAVALAVFLCRLIHKAKMADRALRIQRPEPTRRKTDANGRGNDSDRHAA